MEISVDSFTARIVRFVVNKNFFLFVILYAVCITLHGDGRNDKMKILLKMASVISSNSQISEWYSGKCVFITGASGFLGKVLMEKLLRSCPDIKTIYILLRSKKGVLQEYRLAELLNDPLYDIIRKNNPENFTKIVIINGDVTQQSLGISPEDRAVLVQNVSIVFHSAATVKFNDALPTSFGMNVVGTKEMINLASEMKNLQAFVHISTAFSNCNRMEIEEKLYDPPIELEKLVQIINILDDDTLNYLTPKILKDWPNTYTFTKACAEHLVSSHAKSGNFPAVIVRPSIVTAAWQEPLPGWVHNFSGLTGMIITAGKGICRAFPCQKKAGNFVPVDVVINLMVAVGWHVGENKYDNVPIYNCSSEIIKPVLIKDMNKTVLKWIRVYPLNKTLWYPSAMLIDQKQLCRIYNIMTRTIPAYIFDTFSIILGRKTFAVKISKKIDDFLGAYEYFMLSSWKFHSDNIPKLVDTLSETDKRIFNFDLRSMNWDEYIKNYQIGIKKYIEKDNMNNLPKARANIMRLKIIYYIFNTLILLGSLFICFKYIFNN